MVSFVPMTPNLNLIPNLTVVLTFTRNEILTSLWNFLVGTQR